MSDIKWIKIVTDIFDDEKILLIESMPDADSLIVIWFKLLCLAGKQNNSGVFVLNGRLPYTDEMFATIFRRPINTVRLALKTFEELGMIEIINNTVTIPNWGKHQNFDKIEAKTAYMREYMKGYREKQKSLTDGKTNGKSNDKANHKANVSEADKIREDKIREDKKEIREDTNSVRASEIAEIVDYLNDRAGTHYKPTTDATKRHINARLAEGYTVDDFRAVIDKKCAEWLGGDMEKFLRPETLFGSKFESYLNAPARAQAKKKSSNPFLDMLRAEQAKVVEVESEVYPG